MKKPVTLRLDINDNSYIINTYVDGNVIVDRRVQNFKEVQSQQGIITKEGFRVNLTKELIEAVGDLTDLTQTPKIDIRKRIPGSIILSGQTFSTGSFQIMNIYGGYLKEIKLIFQGDETALKAQTKDILLKDLFKLESVGYNAVDIINYLDGTTDDGYKYGLIDYGQDFKGSTPTATGRVINNPATPLKTSDFKPLVSFKKVIELLEEREGITVDLHASIKDEFLNQWIPLHNNELTTPSLDTSPASNTGFYESTIDRTYTGTGTTTGSFYVVGDDVTNYSNVVFTTSQYTAQRNGIHSFDSNVQLEVSGLPVNSVTSMTLTIEVNGVNTFQGVSQDVYVDTIRPLTLSFSTSGFNLINLNANDVVKFLFSYDQTLSISTTVTYTINDESTISCLSTPNYVGSSNVDIGANFVEGMNVWEHCIKTLVAQFNGIIERTDDGFIITPWVTWIQNGNIIDLNDKVISGQTIKIEPPSTTGAKKIVFEFQEDKDFYNEAYKTSVGDTYGTLKIDDTGVDFAANTVKVTIPYAATPIAQVANSSLIIPKFVNSDGKIIKTKPRLLKFGGYQNETMYIRDDQDVGGVTPPTLAVTQIPYFGHWETLDGGFDTNDYNFGQSLTFFASNGYPNNTLYERFWKAYILETYGINSRKLKLKVHFNAWEIINMNMAEQVFYKDNYYRILRLSGIDVTNPDSPQTIELALRKEFQNIDIAPFYPYNVINTVVQWKDSSTNVDLGDANGQPIADVKESTEAYGYFYDEDENTAIQSGQTLVI